MKLGYLQQQIVKIGREKGYVTSVDIQMLYPRNINIEMNKLVTLGYFKKPEDCLTYIKWEYKGD